MQATIRTPLSIRLIQTSGGALLLTLEPLLHQGGFPPSVPPKLRQIPRMLRTFGAIDCFEGGFESLFRANQEEGLKIKVKDVIQASDAAFDGIEVNLILIS
jgi:hypothetical protein